MTNFERIKSMDIDELSNVLYDANDRVCFENCKEGTGNKYQCPLGDITCEDCKKCIREWLESEVTG